MKNGAVVQAKGEPFTRLVVQIDGERALCKRHGKQESKWFDVSELTEQSLAPIRPVF